MSLKVVNKPNSRLMDYVHRPTFNGGFDSWTPSSLFYSGQAGYWGEYNPVQGLVFQDAAGTTPATLPGQPVGLANRIAGSVDATQGTALSRPTLARWPKGGRRNFLLQTGDADSSVWLKVNVGVTAAGGVSKVTPTIDNAPHRIKSSPVTRPGPFAVSFELKYDGISFVYVQGGGAGTVPVSINLETGVVSDPRWVSTFVGDGWWRYTSTGAAPGTDSDGISWFAANSMTNSTEPVFPGDGTSSFLFRKPQAEYGTTSTPYQHVTTANDITETGVPDIWHLWNDGGDSLNTAPLPAGTYGIAYVDALGGVTVTTETSDGTTPINLLRTERQADVILRQGAFTAAEANSITKYFQELSA